MSVGRPQRLAAGYFLGFIVFAFVLLAWLRGAGRIMIPILLIALAAYALARFIRKIREPVD